MGKDLLRKACGDLRQSSTLNGIPFWEAAYSLIKPDPFRLCLQTVFCSNASALLSLSLFSLLSPFFPSLSDLSIERTPVEGSPSSPKSRLSSVRPNELLNYPKSSLKRKLDLSEWLPLPSNLTLD